MGPQKLVGGQDEFSRVTSVKKSGHRFDVLAEKGREKIAYEVTISTANVESNIDKAFQDKEITGLVIVVPYKTNIQEFKKTIKPQIQKYGMRIEVNDVNEWL